MLSLIGVVRSLCHEGRIGLALETVHILNQQGILISRDVIHFLLQQCLKRKNLLNARQVASLMFDTELFTVPVLVDHLIRLFETCGSLQDAQYAFSYAPKRTIFTWHAILSAHVKLGDHKTALLLYRDMAVDGDVTPDKHVLSCIVSACGSLGAMFEGQLLHHQSMVLNDTSMDSALGNSLIDMYLKCGSLKDARSVFDTLLSKDTLSWGITLSGYAEYGDGAAALALFQVSQKIGVRPDKYIFSGALKACGAARSLDYGRFIHDLISQNGIKADLVLWSALTNMYAKCGNLCDAHKVFNELEVRDTALWGVIIGGYVEHNLFDIALELYGRMQVYGVQSDSSICIHIIRACCYSSDQRSGYLLHHKIIESGNEINIMVENSLIDMYCKYGAMEDAVKVFGNIQNPENVPWATLIRGYAEHGDCFLALELFERMDEESLKPCRISLMCALQASSSIQAVNEGRWLHDKIVRDGHEQDNAMVCTLMDMYVKCGSLEEAYNVFSMSSTLDSVLWGVMIAAFAQYKEDIRAVQLFQKMKEKAICPEVATILHVLKACGSGGMFWLGKLIHDDIIRTGKGEDGTIGNAILNMYASCGRLQEACKIFSSLPSQDIVSWGTMIVAFSEHGLFDLSMEYFGDMQRKGIQPNDVILLNILAACSRSGMLEKGYHYFTSMAQRYGDCELYNCMVDLLVRVGCFSDAEDLILTLQDKADPNVYTSLLTSCKTYGKADFASQYFEKNCITLVH